jgi:hypothetical protein
VILPSEDTPREDISREAISREDTAPLFYHSPVRFYVTNLNLKG